MFRPLFVGVLAAGLIASAVPGTTAQDKKAQPKKKERIAIAEPKEAAKDPDFATQGEYVGELSIKGQAEKIGAQVVAKGAGEFSVRVLRGGLPGAGWDGKTTKSLSATRAGNKVVMKLEGKEVGTIADGTMTLTPTEETVTLKKVDRKSETLGKKTPQGAVVLYAEPGDEKNWTNGRLLDLSDGKFLTVARLKTGAGKEQGGNITSKEKFGAFKAHIEFRTPWMPNSGGQQRGNSGVYIQDRYECQVLDSFGLSGENNECGGFYQQHKPVVNMCLPPLSWQTYDIDFVPAEFDQAGKKTKNARVTVVHNGVKIHDNVELPKETAGGKPENPMPGPFQFQDHGDPVVYKNVWVVPAK